MIIEVSKKQHRQFGKLSSNFYFDHNLSLLSITRSCVYRSNFYFKIKVPLHNHSTVFFYILKVSKMTRTVNWLSQNIILTGKQLNVLYKRLICLNISTSFYFCKVLCRTTETSFQNACISKPTTGSSVVFCNTTRSTSARLVDNYSLS